MFGQGNFGSFDQGPNKIAQPYHNVHPTFPRPPHVPMQPHPSSLQQSYSSPHPPPTGQLVPPVIPSAVHPGLPPLQFPPAPPPHLSQTSSGPSLQGSTFRAVQTNQYPSHYAIPNAFHIPPPPTHPLSMVPSHLPNQSEQVRPSQLPRVIPPPPCQRPTPYVIPNRPSSTAFFPHSQNTLLQAPISFSDFSFSSLGPVSCSASESPPPPPPPSFPPPEPPSPPSPSPSNLSATTDLMAISNEDIDLGLHSNKFSVSEQPSYNSLHLDHPAGEYKNQCASGSALEDLSSSDSIDFDIPLPPQKPICEKLVQRIDNMCQDIVRNGPDYEEIILMEASGKPEFKFLFAGDPGSEEAIAHDYYLWMKRKCLLQLKNPHDNEDSDISSPPPEETKISTQVTNVNDIEITYHGDSDMDMEDDIISFEKNIDIRTTSKKESPNPVVVHNAVDLYEPLHPEHNFPCHEEADNVSSDSSIHHRPIEFTEKQKGDFIHGGVCTTTGNPVYVDRGEEKDIVTQSDQIIVGLEHDHFLDPSVERSSPFRLLQGYASDESCGDHEDTHRSHIAVHLNKIDVVVTPQRRNVDTDVESRSPYVTEVDTAMVHDSAASISDNISQEISKALSEPHNHVEGDVSVSKEKITDDLIEINETRKAVEDLDGGDSHANIIVEHGVKNYTEDGKNGSTSVKVDEFGRLVREGVSESNSDESYYTEKRISRGRSWSRSISPKRGSGRRKRVPSPRKRRARSRSRSLSSKRRREWSGSPINKNSGGVHDNEYKHDRSHVPDCFDFIRGRCYRGGSCRYFHHNAATSDARRYHRSKDMYVEGPDDSENPDFYPSHRSYSQRKNLDRDGQNVQFFEEVPTGHVFSEERKPGEIGNLIVAEELIQNLPDIGKTQPISNDNQFCCITDEDIAEAQDVKEIHEKPDVFSDLSESGHSIKQEILSEVPTNTDIALINDEIESVSRYYHDMTDNPFKAPVIPYQECSPEPEGPEMPEHDSDKRNDEPSVSISSVQQVESLQASANLEYQDKRNYEHSVQISLSDQPAEFSSHEPCLNIMSSSPIVSVTGTVSQPLPSEVTSNCAIEKECPPVSASATDFLHKPQQFPPAAPLPPSSLEGNIALQELHMAAPVPPPYSRQQGTLTLPDPPRSGGSITSSSGAPDTLQIFPNQAFSPPQVSFPIQQSHLALSSAPFPQPPMVLPPPPPLLPPRPLSLPPPPPLLPYGGRPNTVVPSSHIFWQGREPVNKDFVSNPWMPFPGKFTSISTPPNSVPPVCPINQEASRVAFPVGDSTIKNMPFRNQLSVTSEGPTHSREEFLHFPRPNSAPMSFYPNEASHQHTPFSTDSFSSSVMQKYPSSLDQTEAQYPDHGISRFGSRQNPYASTFEQPLNIKFNTNALRQENELHHGKLGINSGLGGASANFGAASGYGSRLIGTSLNSSQAGQVLPDSVDRQYDPLFDSIDPSSNSYRRSDSIPMKDSEGEFGNIFGSGNSKIPSILEVENSTKHPQDTVPPTVTVNSEHGEKEDEVGVVDDDSLSNLNDLAKAVIGDIEIDQVISQGKKKKTKDSKSMKLFKVSLADFVKEVLKPSWRQGNMSKEAFKTIVKKTVDKVSGAMKGHHVPRSQTKINQYIDSSQRKLTKLVMGYVDKYVKL